MCVIPGKFLFALLFGVIGVCFVPLAPSKYAWLHSNACFCCWIFCFCHSRYSWTNFLVVLLLWPSMYPSRSHKKNPCVGSGFLMERSILGRPNLEFAKWLRLLEWMFSRVGFNKTVAPSVHRYICDYEFDESVECLGCRISIRVSLAIRGQALLLAFGRRGCFVRE